MGSVKSTIKDTAKEAKNEVMREMMVRAAIQREIQMSISIAQTRDLMQWMGGVWSVVTTGALLKTVKTGSPGVVAVPAAVLTVALCYQYDLAYGNKMQRVAKEAEHIMLTENKRFVPPSAAPFFFEYEKMKQEMEATGEWDKNTRVGELYPSFLRDSLFSTEGLDGRR
eukprot:g698.t1